MDATFIPFNRDQAAVEAGVPPAMVLADAGYGIDTAFRDGITELGLTYVVGIQSPTSIWPPAPRPCRQSPGAGVAGRHR